MRTAEKNTQSTVGDEECKDYIFKMENQKEQLIMEDIESIKDPKMALKAQIASRMKNSTRIADILQNKLHEHSNQRGNIIYNSLGTYRRNFTKHSGKDFAVADPKVYNILGKLHTRVPVPTTYGTTGTSSVSKLDIKKLQTSESPRKNSILK